MMPPSCLANSDLCGKIFHSSRDLWFGRLSLSTRIVAVGLILEAPELVFEIRAIIRRAIDKWKLHITFPESHPPDWAKVVAFVGWFLIVGGVVGEWVSADEVNGADISIQELNDTLFKNVRAELKTAENELANAEEQEVVSRIHLKRYADMLSKKPPTREVPQQLMISILKKSPTGTVMILCQQDNTGEAYKTARGILLALHFAGWTISPFNSGGAFCVPPNGTIVPPGFFPPGLFPLPEMDDSEILIIGDKKSLSEPFMGNSALGALEHALGTLGGGIGLPANEHVPDGTFWILVGPAKEMPFR